MSKLISYIYTLGVLLIAILLLSSCFVVNNDLFNGLITAKHLWVQALALLVCVCIAIYLLFVKSISIKWFDIGVLLLMIWMIGRECFSTMPYANFQDNSLLLLLYVGIYVFFRIVRNENELHKYIVVIYLLIVSIEAIYGLMQLYGFTYSNHGLFNITGHFHNPGPFSGFIVSGLPMALGLYFATRYKTEEEGKKAQFEVASDRFFVFRNPRSVFSKWIRDNQNKLLNYFSQFVIVVLLLVLPAARSRAAWLGGIIGCLYVLYYNKGTLRNVVLPSWLFVLQKKYVVPVITLILLVSLLGLYKFKQGSADGRLLMWQVSWEMIKDKPITGWGQGGFEAQYANYQANWFKNGKGTPEQEMVAGVPDAPFNELIRIGINYGLIAIFGMFALLTGLFRRGLQRATENHRETLCYTALLKGGLLSIIIFSLFSYSLDVAAIIVQTIVLLALITNILPNALTLNVIPNPFIFIPKLAAIMLLVLVFLGVQNVSNQYKGLRYWQEAYQLYQYGIYDDAAEEYVKANSYLPCNGQLKQMYGKCLAMDEKWKKASVELENAKLLRSDPILYTTLGSIYQKQKNYLNAEIAYKQASFIEPHKFYPQYLLAKLYNEKGQNYKAKIIAKNLMNKKVKVSSSAITEMRTELKRLLQK
jgi:O-antigen ligase